MTWYKVIALIAFLIYFNSIAAANDDGPRSGKEIPVSDNQGEVNAEISDGSQNKAYPLPSPLLYELQVTMVNYEDELMKVSQQIVVPEGVEIVSYTLDASLANATRQKRRAGQEQMTQWTGGVFNIQPGYRDTAEMAYINHPAEILTPNSKTFHKLAANIKVLTDGTVGGEIFTPDYPGNYPNGADITWVISYPNGNVVRLEMLDFSMEECCDHLIIYDGLNKSRSVLATFDGDFYAGDSNVVVSTKPAMFLRFTSDCLVTGYGFRASYINQKTSSAPTDPTPMSCGPVQTFNGNAGQVFSPNYPGYYDDDMNCTWSVQTYYGTKVRFTFWYFNLRYGDYLRIYDGTPSYPGSRLFYSSGSGYYRYTVTAHSNRAFLVFTSDFSSTSNGFNISYEGVNEPVPTTIAQEETSAIYYYNPSQCSGISYNSGNGGDVTSPGYYSPTWYPPYENCQWRIQVSSGYNVGFYVHYFYTEYYDDWVYIYNGYSTSSYYRIASLTGYIDQYTYVAIASSNQATVTFYSDCCNSGYRGFRLHFYSTYDSPTTTDAPDAQMTTGYDMMCNGPQYYSGYSGYVYSPNYPSYYYDNLNCSYWIQTPYGTDVGLTIQSFSLGSGDYLRIYNGYNDYYIYSLSGYYSYGYYINTYTNYVQMVFTSNYGYTSSGFSIRYSADYSYYYTTASPADYNCSSTMPNNYGTITSPDYPSYYPLDLDCIWTVQVYSNMYVLFTFNYFQTEAGYDYVGFYKGTPTNSQGEVEHCSGYYSPGTEVLVRDNEAYVVFHSDYIITDKGFSISYSPVNTYYQTSTGAPDSYTSSWWRTNVEIGRAGDPKVIGRDLWNGAKNRPIKRQKDEGDEKKP